LRDSKGVGVTIESYGKVEISYRIIIIIIIIIIIRNGAKTISLQTLFGRLNYITTNLTFLVVINSRYYWFVM
jgi:hypothetical protein